MNSQLIVDYIGKKRAAGYSEDTIRRALLNKGLSEQVTQELFRRYRQSQQAALASPDEAKELRRGERIIRPKWPLRRSLKLIAKLLVVATLAGGTYWYFYHHKPTPTATVPKPLTTLQKQTLDASTVASAVSQYAQANGALPALLSVGVPSNVLVLCNTSCDSTSSLSIPLNIYEPSNVRLEPYATSLTPNDQTMYLIAGAKCKDHTTVGDSDTRARAMVLLYATAGGTVLNNHCISL